MKQSLNWSFIFWEEIL